MAGALAIALVPFILLLGCDSPGKPGVMKEYESSGPTLDQPLDKKILSQLPDSCQSIYGKVATADSSHYPELMAEIGKSCGLAIQNASLPPELKSLPDTSCLSLYDLSFEAQNRYLEAHCAAYTITSYKSPCLELDGLRTASTNTFDLHCGGYAKTFEFPWKVDFSESEPCRDARRAHLILQTQVDCAYGEEPHLPKPACLGMDETGKQQLNMEKDAAQARADTVCAVGK